MQYEIVDFGVETYEDLSLGNDPVCGSTSEIIWRDTSRWDAEEQDDEAEEEEDSLFSHLDL